MKLTLTEKLLIVLNEIIEDIDDVVTTYTWTDFYKKIYQKPPTIERIRSTIHYLEKKGYVDVNRKGKGKLYKITPYGKNKIRKYTFSKKDWDKKWRIVVFDIPEKKRNFRDYFRYKLKELGFKKLQKSVWISPFDVLNETEELVNEHRIKSYVKCILADYINDQEKLLSEFISGKK